MKINILTHSAFFAAVIFFSGSPLFARVETKISATIRVGAASPPVAVADAATTAQMTPVTLTVLANDIQGSAMIDPLTVMLINPYTGASVLSVTILYQGTFNVNPLDGTITFTPIPGFGSVVKPVNYTVQDITGVLSNQAEIIVTVTPTPPTAVPDFATTQENTPVSLTVWNNDIAGTAMIDPQIVKLIDPVTGLRVFSYNISGEGLFAVNYLTGVVTFTPVAGFVGTSAINYVVQDLNGEFSNQAAITVDVTAKPLPVTLAVFIVSKEARMAKLNWETTAETNSDHFEIQHSITGKKWSKIGEVVSEGESTMKKSYTFTDLNPANGGNLYRLKMIDKDAAFTYSRIQSVTFETGNDLSVYPNPVASELFIRDYSAVTRILITDLMGRTVYQSGVPTTGTINVTTLPTGMYIMNTTWINGPVSSQKIVVRK
ncbi:Ig-like domain-containing protein [Dyadobacter frigoris]|uniref:T9SS type A sorting domain-containing protein n=1 Tax=Dyadobacter frigoris TaxID=2576211 RepID=A0A4U6CVU8_9BACT|nr:Ig-like domain-containing protein [Dyadobacter frigoris]TKT88802.1 T9SS type A sorting domain-containing protein [Dyadobacter frigoris]GLU53999.1 hypothetical protein Dfri01_34600 [Dyadobacter frigoris]